MIKNTDKTNKVLINGLKATVITSTLLAASVSHALSFEVGNTKATVYGYAKATFIYDLDHDLGRTTGGIQGLPASSAQSGSRFQAHAAETRVGFTTKTGKFNTKIEGDFFGSGNTTFRLRHAYGSYGNWLAGQNWTNFMHLSAYPGTVDFQGPAGALFARQTQLRYTTGGFSASIEDPLANSDQPAITAAYKYKAGGRTLKIAGIYNGDVTDGVVEDDAYGISIGASTPLWSGAGLRVQYTTGTGVSPYLINGGAARFDANGDALDVDGYSIALTQKAGPGTAGIAFGNVEFDDGAVGTTESIQTLHVNYTVKPTKNLAVGLEYYTGERDLFGGGSSDADRILSTMKYSF